MQAITRMVKSYRGYLTEVYKERRDMRPNWKEQPPSESLTGKEWR